LRLSLLYALGPLLDHAHAVVNDEFITHGDAWRLTDSEFRGAPAR
jgi:hypothetical protein